jgi:hypothetical protein
MKFSLKFFIVLGLVAILASLFASTAFAGGIKTRGLVEVTKYAVLNNQPLTLQFKGYFGCDAVQVSGAVRGKEIYVTLQEIKFVGNGKACKDERPYGYTKQISFANLVPGAYTVYVNPDGNGKYQKKFKVVAPLLPTPTLVSTATAAPAPAKP